MSGKPAQTQTDGGAATRVGADLRAKSRADLGAKSRMRLLAGAAAACAAFAAAPQAAAQSTSPLRCWVESGQFLLDPEGRAIACKALYPIVEIQNIVVNAGECAEGAAWLRRKKLPSAERSILGRRYREGEEFRFFVVEEKRAPGGLPKACEVRAYTIKANDVEWMWKR
jgi:hypothetical protein